MFQKRLYSFLITNDCISMYSPQYETNIYIYTYMIHIHIMFIIVMYINTYIICHLVDMQKRPYYDHI